MLDWPKLIDFSRGLFQVMGKIISSKKRTIICGDSTISESYVELKNAGRKCQLILTDPPYCLLTRRRKSGQLRDPHRRKFKIEHAAVTRFENVKEYRTFTKKWMEQAQTHLIDDGVMCIWTNFLGKEPIKTEALALGYQFHGEFTWAKLSKEGGGNERTARVYEVALIFKKGPPRVLTNDELPICWSVVGHYDDDGEAQKWGGHPNYKSFNVLEPLIRTYSRPGDLILDPFSGSGAIASASIKLDRDIYAIELNDEWAQMAAKRVELL